MIWAYSQWVSEGKTRTNDMKHQGYRYKLDIRKNSFESKICQSVEKVSFLSLEVFKPKLDHHPLRMI